MQALYLIIINLIVVFLGLFIHGDPPKHYYLIIYPIPIILMAYYLSKIQNKILTSILIVYGVFSIWCLIYSGWYKTNTPYLYKTVTNITNKIIKDANGRKFGIKRVGEFDYFENNFANNYIYLFNINGVKIENNSKLIYTIYEDKNTYSKEK